MFTTRFILECWNPSRNRYEKRGEYSTIERAVIMFNKPYFRIATRKLIKVTREVLRVARQYEE